MNKTFLMTLATMAAMCGIVVLCTLTPLSTLGEHSNQFGDAGMVSALLGVAAPYLIPGILMASGIRPAKIFLTIVNGVFLLASAAVGITALSLWQTVFGGQPNVFMTALLFCCVLSVVLHIAWFPVAFSRQRA